MQVTDACLAWVRWGWRGGSGVQEQVGLAGGRPEGGPRGALGTTTDSSWDHSREENRLVGGKAPGSAWPC